MPQKMLYFNKDGLLDLRVYDKTNREKWLLDSTFVSTLSI